MQCLQVALHLYERKSPPDMGEVGMNFSIRFQLIEAHIVERMNAAKALIYSF